MTEIWGELAYRNQFPWYSTGKRREWLDLLPTFSSQSQIASFFLKKSQIASGSNPPRVFRTMAHGADQFHPDDDRNKATFFMIFYFSVNIGSLIATFISPLLRKLKCGGLGTVDSCYFLAFGVPFIVMAS